MCMSTVGIQDAFTEPNTTFEAASLCERSQWTAINTSRPKCRRINPKDKSRSALVTTPTPENRSWRKSFISIAFQKTLLIHKAKQAPKCLFCLKISWGG